MKGTRRFTLPKSGRSLFISDTRYPRLFEWVQNADAWEDDDQ